MNLVITGKQLELTDAMKHMVEEELAFLTDVLPEDKPVTVTIEANPTHKASVLFYHNGDVVRLEQDGRDIYVLFPQLAKRLKKHLRGIDKLSRAFKKETLQDKTPMSQEVEDIEVSAEVTKRKRFEMKPMSEKEAVLQMRMLGHEQFIFANADMQNTICLLYTRKDGDFGVIETTY